MGNRAGGIPIARTAEVNIHNNHMQYIVTWYVPSPLCPYAPMPSPKSNSHRYGLSAATTVMFFLLVKRPPPNITKRVRQSSEW